MHGTDSCSTYLSDPPDVLVARLVVEAEVLVQPEPDVVPIEAVRELVQVEEVLLERARDRRLPVRARGRRGRGRRHELRRNGGKGIDDAPSRSR